MKISLFVLAQLTNVTDGQTDGRCMTAKTALMHRAVSHVSHGKQLHWTESDRTYFLFFLIKLLYLRVHSGLVLSTQICCTTFSSLRPRCADNQVVQIFRTARQTRQHVVDVDHVLYSCRTVVCDLQQSRCLYWWQKQLSVYQPPADRTALSGTKTPKCTTNDYLERQLRRVSDKHCTSTL